MLKPKNNLWTTPQARMVLCWILLLAVYVLLRVNLLDIPLERDEGAFGYVGQVLNRGGMLYRDVFDHKLPLLYHIYAWGLHLFPPTARGLHLFVHAYGFLTLVALFFTARLYFGSTRAACLTAFAYAVFASSPAIQGFAATSEAFMLLPLVLSLLFTLLALSRSSRGLMFLAGVFGAVACWIKPQAFTSLLAVFVLLYQHPPGASTGSHWQERARLFLFWLFGGVLLSGIIVGYYAVHGLFRELMYWGFQHNMLYAEDGRSLGWNFYGVGQRLLEIIRENPVAVITSISGTVLAWLQQRTTGWFLLAFISLSLLGTLPGHNYTHYFMQLAPAMALSSGYALAFLLRPGSGKGGGELGYLVLAMMIFLPFQLNRDYYLPRDKYSFSHEYYDGNPFVEAEAVAGYLSDQTKPGDQVLIMGTEAEILFLAQRPSATRHIIFYPLMRSAYRYKRFQQQAWEDIEKSRPAYIITVSVSASLLWDGKAELWIFDRVGELLDKEYQLEAWIPVADEAPRLRRVSGDSAKERQAREKYGQVLKIFRRRVAGKE